VLIVQGERDFQVTSQDARLLSAAMPQAELLLLPTATHMLKDDVPGNPLATYQDKALPLASGLVPTINAFISKNTPFE
jgi:uncharacterized protein